MDYIPVLQRAGTIVPLQMRLRRSASQMKHDPFTLRVIGDPNDSAIGHVYHDERDGYGYEENQYAYMEYVLKNGVLTSKRTEEGVYDCPNQIERIIMKLQTIPKSVSIEVGGVTRAAEFIVDKDHMEITIRKPNVRVTEEWTIRMHQGDILALFVDLQLKCIRKGQVFNIASDNNMDTCEKTKSVILGIDYSEATDHELRETISSLFYISYRYGYFPIEDTFFRFDVGWGCTLRSTQMLLAEVSKLWK